VRRIRFPVWLLMAAVAIAGVGFVGLRPFFDVVDERANEAPQTVIAVAAREAPGFTV
jgi:hypothetical protein